MNPTLTEALAPTDIDAARELLAHARRMDDAALFAHALAPHWTALHQEICERYGMTPEALWTQTLVGLGYPPEQITNNTTHLRTCRSGQAAAEIAWCHALPIPMIQPHLRWLRHEARVIRTERPDLYAEQGRRDLACVGPAADLTRANLTYADLTSANLTRANLTYADLTYADLTSANLTRANLTYADLTYADLTYADLTRANLTSANLTRANLTPANLTRANLTPNPDAHWQTCPSCYPRHSPATRWPAGWTPLTPAAEAA